MLLVPPDPSTPRPPSPDCVYVWESVSAPGLYGLSKNRLDPEHQTAGWKFRGELSVVRELAALDRWAVKRRTENGWPMIVRLPPPGDPMR